jgi:hypothetical protein
VNFDLIHTGWGKVLDDAVSASPRSIRVVCPFIKRKAAERLLKQGAPPTLQVITRFNLDEFFLGVSDLTALHLLIDHGAQIRGIRHLHSKLYLFGDDRAVVTSANLTEAALRRNHEFGFVAGDSGVVHQCHQYFDLLWDGAGPDLAGERLVEWEERITERLANGTRIAIASGLGDEGADLGFAPEPIESPAWVREAGQAFVKFFGESHRRENPSARVLKVVDESGSNWACPYPRDKRPRQVNDGALMFIGRMVTPNDTLIYGRAVGMRYVDGRDDATAAEVQRRSWKKKWPHYVRIHHPEFIAGKLSDGVSLNELMAALGSDAFARTQENAASGIGNTNPRRAYMQQAAVELTPQAISWINERLERAYETYGKLSPAILRRLEQPDPVVVEIPNPRRRARGRSASSR